WGAGAMSISDKGHEELQTGRAAIAIAIGIASGFALVLLPYALVWLQAAITHQDFGVSLTAISGFNSSLTLTFPFVQGLGMAIALGRGRQSFGNVAFLCLILLLVEVFAAGLFLREGIICLIIAAPVAFVLIACGAALGRGLMAWRAQASRSVQV